MKELIEKLSLPIFRDRVRLGAILVILVKERCRKSAKHPHYREFCLIVTEIGSGVIYHRHVSL